MPKSRVDNHVRMSKTMATLMTLTAKHTIQGTSSNNIAKAEEKTDFGLIYQLIIALSKHTCTN